MKYHAITIWDTTTVFEVKEFCERYGFSLHIRDNGNHVLVHDRQEDKK